MRRIADYLFTIFAAVSLLVCVTAGAMWVRSAHVPDVYERSTRPRHDVGRLQLFASHQGVLFLVTHEIQLNEEAARRVDDELRVGMATPWTSYWARRPYPRNFPSRSYFQLPTASQPLERLGIYVRLTERSMRTRTTPVRERICTVGVPYGMLMAITSIAPAVYLRKLWRARRAASRRRASLCPACGYDLRASLGRCPECGTAPSASGMEIAGASEQRQVTT